MEVKMKKTKSGNTYKFVNESWSNSNGWGHKTTIIKNMYDYEPHKVRYINRTWEMYQYQSCMFGAIECIFGPAQKDFMDRYKEEHGITRFTKKTKEEAMKEFEKTEIYQDVQELKEAVQNRKFDYYN